MSIFYHGDCLFVLRHDIQPDSVDLIYLDPPFFTGKVQKGEWRPEAMEITFEDSKQFWADKAEVMRDKAPMWLRHLALTRPDLASYLYYMMVRLEACQRVLKSTGSIFLHCDQRASHYLKMVMDELFHYQNLRNEIIWAYTNSGGRGKTAFAKKHDTIFWYSKSASYTFNNDDPLIMVPRRAGKDSFGGIIAVDEEGRKYQEVKSSGKAYRYYLDEGKIPEDVWTIQPIPPHSRERTGYPTQKPEALLERIIRACSKQGDIVLDPFCGCGTTVIAASKLGREWIGIDIDTSPRQPGTLPTAFQVISNRSHSLFQQAKYITRDIGEVMEMDGHAFEVWVNEFYKATKPSPDRGVDGITPEGIPIQAKIYEIKYPVLSQFATDSKYHPNVPQPVKRVRAVSKTGFDDGARKRKFEIETKEGIVVELVTPTDILRQDD